ncbi:O-antigen ligase family protein [Bradyrhizobium sp.]|uniref:O-antigen ligase family protein n=1 Tax=Bradyrhizobium sp. TaxID=376 RepID=UPI003C715CC0
MIYTTTGPPTGVSLAEKLQSVMTPRLENKIFWPILAAITLVLVARNWSRLAVPPHIKWLFAYLALAGTSVLWAFKPDVSFVRFVQQAMIVTSIVLPTLLAARTADMIRGLFLCFAFAVILNVPFVLAQAPITLQEWNRGGGLETLIIGYPGYFTFKGLLGECAAIAFLLSLHEMLYPRWRRALGIIVAGIAIYLMIVSQSKGSLGLALLAPLLAGLVLIITRVTRISTAIILLPVPLCYALFSSIIGNIINRISYILFNNYTLSGRTIIWDFVNSEIARKPLFGWGYQSFWLAGLDAPSITDAPGWIKTMPSAHNGYLDTMLDTGYLGVAILIAFIFTTLHAIGRSADRQPARAWLLLSLALFVILTNFLESTWLHGMDVLWLMFVIVAAETGRYWQPSHPGAFKPPLRGPVIAGRRPGLARAWAADGLARFPRRRT